MHQFLTLGLGLALSATLQAAPYQSVQLDKSSVQFSYRQMGVAMEGRFKKFTPQLSFDPLKPEQAKASIDIDLASIDTGSGEADQEVAGKSWFNTAAHPKAVFSLQQVKSVAPNQYEAVGLLAIKGQSREVRFPLRHVAQGRQGVLMGEFTLKRGDFSIGEGMWSKFDVIANDVQVRFQLIAQPGK